MGLFDDKQYVSKEEFRRALQDKPVPIPGNPGQYYNRTPQECEAIVKKFFEHPGKAHLSRSEFDHFMKQEERATYGSISPQDRLQKRGEIELLRGLAKPSPPPQKPPQGPPPKR